MTHEPATVCAVDVGSTSIKAAVFDSDLRRLGHANTPFPKRTLGSTAEAEPEAIWHAFSSTIRRARASAHVEPQTMIVAAQMAGLVLLDERDQPIGDAILSLDRRGEPPAQPSPRSGCSVDGLYPANKLRWLMSSDPDRVRSARRIGGIKEYLLHRLTERWVTDPSSASASGLYDLKTLAWSEEMASDSGISLDVLPPVARPTDIAGISGVASSADCQLAPGTPVLVGLGDGPASNIASGAIGTGHWCMSMGTTLVFRLLVRTQPPAYRSLGWNEHTFIHHVDRDWYTFGMRWTPTDGTYTEFVPTGGGSPASPTDVAAAMEPALQRLGAEELHVIGNAAQRTGVLEQIATALQIPIRVSHASDATHGMACLALSDPNDPISTLADRTRRGVVVERPT
ncbi:MAG: FGGY-family carbohydrate kinase [Actinomycetota bacterium]